MYNTILVPLEVSPTDRAIVEHVKDLAKIMGSRVVLLHVATGVPAQWSGPDAAGQEVEEDRAFLEKIRAEFEALGITAEAELAYGVPAKEIIKWVQEHECDLIAMSTHGHHFVGDLLFGVTACPVRHGVNVPVLLLKAR